MSKKTVLLIIALALFGAAFILLLTAMVFHAAFNDGFVMAAFVAAGSAFVSFLAVIFAALSGKKKEESHEEHKA